MRGIFRRFLVSIAGFALVGAVAVPAQGASDRGVEASGGRAEHDRVVAFWTPERVAQAIPRDFEFDPATGRFRQVPAAKPGGRPGGGGGGGGSTSVLGASWTTGGLVAETSGKVLFQMGSTYYVCSANVITDAVPDRSLVLTAAHCAYDEANGEFATNWLFIPNYDASAPSLTTNQSFCGQTEYGCWTADALVVHDGYASAGAFNVQAVQHDYAVAVVGVGGKAGTAELDETVGAQPVSFAPAVGGSDTFLFGYPAAGKYKGKDLVYSRGPLGLDPYNGNLAYRVASNMTGGASGGPWFTPFDVGTAAGPQFSVTSYGYSGQTYLHGPFFDLKTEVVYTAATTATGNTIVPVP